MKKFSRMLFLTMLVVVTTLPAVAQEEDDAGDDGGRFGSLFAEASLWIAQVNGTEFAPATDRSTGIATLVSPEDATESEARYRAGYELANNAGSIAATWYSHRQEWSLEGLTPGQFDFGEILAAPAFAGFAHDGLADGFNAAGETLLRDLRIDFFRTAFQGRRARGDWFVGVRRVEHKRRQNVAYSAVLPPLPAYLPGAGQPTQPLPTPDVAVMRSDFDGRGIEAGMEIEMPVFKDKVAIEGGFAVGVMRGDVDTFYTSTNHLYLFDGEVLDPDDYDTVLSDPDMLADVENTTVSESLRSVSESGSSDVIETYLGVRWRAWRKLEVFAGWRTARYTGVGRDLRPVGGDTEAFDEVSRDAFYEGFYGGVGYSF